MARGFVNSDGQYVGRSIAVVFEPKSIAKEKAKKVRAQKRKKAGYIAGDTTDEEEEEVD